ncbi:flagellar type III secretion system pore protein FliP [Pseudoalteromonas marina]|uniref:Flagellar biosynthetic protein FliP n=1 Tax=Pseudoalteromonas marina TaxID=267375 RepID=A0ABT9FC22_9GAMM|nr:flagellar type III secretion system pore protein FliP [Pseudoalteromonas marina]MDP2564328.1 flagellar type III secretion system pore protein FliP [Pseudoalteromonas marina]
MKKFLALVLLLCPLFGFAETGQIDLLTVTPNSDGTESYSSNIQTLIIMSMLPFLTAGIVMFTPFMRTIIVFGFLRQALGTMNSPPNQVLIAISLMVSFIVMKPVLSDIYNDGYLPYESGVISDKKAVEVGVEKMTAFWLSVTSEEELIYFSELMDAEPVDEYKDLPLSVIMPAFVYSELKIAFKIAFLLFIPFLLIDIVIASTLMGMGMMMLSPMIISLPFKIFAFILLDGFGLVTTSMIGSYGAN